MAYEVNFGSMKLAGSRPGVKKTGKFRIALLGDFSARANTGKLDTGTALAARKPMKVDCDNVDATLKKLGVKLRLPMGAEGGVVELAVNSMDDLHPDQLYSNLPIFSELSGLRQRLKTQSTFAKAAAEVQSWAGVKITVPEREQPRSSAIPVEGKLNDFARLVGVPTAPAKATVSIAEMLKQMVGPYVVPAKDPRQDQLVATVDSALAATMRSVLHQPDFQSFEALWRSVDMLVRRLETDEQLQIVLYDVTAEEIASDLSKADDLPSTGLYKLLVEQPAMDAAQGTFSVVIGHYQFEQTPPHAELLGRVAKIVAQTQTAFFASVGTSCIDTKPADLDQPVKEAWDALAKMPEAGYLGLAVPRFMLRMPYGKQTDPIDSFNFEEFTPQAGLTGMLWGNPAVIAGLLLGATFSKQGDKMQPGSVLSLGEMAFYYFTDPDGDQTALPCTERMLTSAAAELVLKHRFMPLLSMKGTPEVRLAGFNSLTGGKLSGTWKPVTESTPEPEPEPEPEPVAEETPEETPAEPEAAEATEESTEATAETPASEPDPELDKLLAELSGDTPAEAPTEEPAPAEEPAATPESAPAEGGEGEMDPELAKLLKDLGG
jgi:type VI secretion system protein ImpC